MKSLLVMIALMLFASISFAEDVFVNGYFRRDGTYVAPHYRSEPNAYKWDNKSYTPSQPAYNDSYYQPSKHKDSDWYTPSTTRFNDSNPYNDSPTLYKSQDILRELKAQERKKAYGY